MRKLEISIRAFQWHQGMTRGAWSQSPSSGMYVGSIPLNWEKLPNFNWWFDCQFISNTPFLHHSTCKVTMYDSLCIDAKGVKLKRLLNCFKSVDQNDTLCSQHSRWGIVGSQLKQKIRACHGQVVGPEEHWTQAVKREWVPIPVMTLVSLGKTLPGVKE